MTVYVVVDMGGRIFKVFLNPEPAHKYILKQHGKYNMYDIEEHEVDTKS